MKRALLIFRAHLMVFFLFIFYFLHRKKTEKGSVDQEVDRGRERESRSDTSKTLME